MQLHQRGVDLLVNVLDAADRVEKLRQDEIRALLKEMSEVLAQILERDAITVLNGAPAPAGWVTKPANTVSAHSAQIQIPAVSGEPGE